MNPRPLGYEPNELPDCSTPRQEILIVTHRGRAVVKHEHCVNCQCLINRREWSVVLGLDARIPRHCPRDSHVAS